MRSMPGYERQPGVRHDPRVIRHEQDDRQGLHQNRQIHGKVGAAAFQRIPGGLCSFGHRRLSSQRRLLSSTRLAAPHSNAHPIRLERPPPSPFCMLRAPVCAAV